jgi:hypothetical protein
MENEIDLINNIAKKREAMDTLDAEKKRIFEEISLLQGELYEQMETKGIKSLSSNDYTATAVKPKLKAQVLLEHREELLRWIDDVRGRADLITHTIHPSTLAKYISEEVIPKGEEPPQYVNLFFEKVIRIRKKGAKNDTSEKE